MKTLLNISKINIKLTLILSVLVMLWSLESNASVYGILKGKVLDSDGKPAIGATVRVLGTTRGAHIKNVSGEFTIVNILAGNYEVVISTYGNSEMKKTINIIADSTLDLGTLKIKNRAISDEIIELNDKKEEDNKFARIGVSICPVLEPFNSEKENGIYTVYTQIIKDYIENRVYPDDFFRMFSFLKYEITTRKIDKNSTENKYSYFDLQNTSILTKEDNTIRQLFPVKSINQRYNAFSFNHYGNTYNYHLSLNEIQRYNPPTAKFGILENLSFTAGVTQ